jgi:hypothetical protein
MVMSQISGGQSYDEGSETNEHDDAFPSEMPSIAMFMPDRFMAMLFMDGISILACGRFTTF